MKDLPVLIAGGGIAGLACALALAPHPVLVLERAGTFEEVGAGLQLGPNAVRALQRLGVWEAVAPITSAPAAIDIRDGLTGKPLMHLPLGEDFERQFGAPYRVAHRAHLHAALLACAKASPHVEIRANAEVIGYANMSGHVRVNLSSGTTLSGRILIGCDGVNSRLRQLAFPGTAPVDSKLVLHRAMPAVPTAIETVNVSAITVWLCPGAHVVHYPVGPLQRLNLVATTDKSSEPRTAHRQSCRALQELLHSVDTWLPWAGLFVPPLQDWYADGLLLLGDAAHGTLPFLAQGAAMALEDAAHLRNSSLDSDRLAIFVANRKQRTWRLHKATLRTAQRYHASGLQRQLRNAALPYIPTSLFWRNLAWLYKG